MFLLSVCMCGVSVSACVYVCVLVDHLLLSYAYICAHMRALREVDLQGCLPDRALIFSFQIQFLFSIHF